MNKAFGQDIELSAGEEAARWLCELQEDAGRDGEFLAWLRRSPQHVEEFLFATTVWKKLNQFGQNHPERIERLIASAQIAERESANVVPLQNVSVAPAPAVIHPRRHAFIGMRVAASLAAIAALAWWASSFLTHAPVYATEVGEQRSVELEDGSVIQLNTHSRVAVSFSEQARDLELLEGEALFTVQRDSSRPFRARSGGTMIQAVGTQFNVYRRAGGTTVSVVEGKVVIEPAAAQTAVQLLAAGEEANIAAGGKIVKRAAPDVRKSVAWRERRLVFRADRLEDVVAEVNRYNPRPIRIEGDAARNLRLSAIFDASDPESLLRFLGKMETLSVDKSGEAVVVRPRAALN